MKNVKWLLQGPMVCLAIDFLTPSVHAEDLLDAVRAKGVLTIGVQGTYPPFDYRNEAGELDGFDVAVAKVVASRMGLTPRFITTEWSGIIAGLQAGKFDVIVNEVAITPLRQATLDFSKPYIYSAVQLIQRADDKRNFKSLDELKGKQVGVVLGTNFADLAKSVPGVGVQVYPGPPEKFRDLAAGRVDAALGDRLTLPYILKKVSLPLRPGGVLAGTSIQMGIPFRKGNPKFANAIDTALESMRQDGTLTKLSIQWFGTDTSKPIME
ncbi:transporter substrate-binding domain-containing protein [Burkholderia sp. MR1-5-21]